MAELVPRNESHSLRHRVQGDIFLVIDALLDHLHREVDIVAAAHILRAVVREEEQNVLRQNTALLPTVAVADA